MKRGRILLLGALGTLAFLAAVVLARGFQHSTAHGWETSAIASLRNLVSAQAQFASTAVVDEDSDGIGEYGSFPELSGAAFVRGTDAPMQPPVLSAAFGAVSEAGTASRSGYHFRIYLADRQGRPTWPVGTPPLAAAYDCVP